MAGKIWCGVLLALEIHHLPRHAGGLLGTPMGMVPIIVVGCSGECVSVLCNLSRKIDVLALR